VALSRVKNLRNLYLIGINRTALAVSQDAQEIDVTLRRRASDDTKKFAHLVESAKNRKSDPTPPKKASNTATGWAEKIAKMRETHPNAYRPWQAEDDETLKQEFQNGTTIEELSKKLGRHEGSVKMRLQKHFGEDVVA
jgi:hypothetical protein